MELFLLGFKFASILLCSVYSVLCSVQHTMQCAAHHAVCITPYSVQYTIECAVQCPKFWGDFSTVPSLHSLECAVHCTANYTINYTLHSVLHTVHQSLQYTLYISVTTKHILLQKKTGGVWSFFCLGLSSQVCCCVQSIVCCAVCSTPYSVASLYQIFMCVRIFRYIQDVQFNWKPLNYLSSISHII